jgi:hypothetical protein
MKESGHLQAIVVTERFPSASQSPERYSVSVLTNMK